MLIKPAPKTFMNNQGEQVVEIGFSGSRIGMSPLQLDILRHALTGKTGIAHHGDCIGSDAEFHDLLRTFAGKWRIIIHPPADSGLRAFKLGDEVRVAKPYLDRNRDIVDSCNVFFATPKSLQQIGGTWYTINYFEKVISHEYGQQPPLPPRVGQILMPDGRIGHIQVDKKRGLSI